jgi:hypothetical protein
MLLHRMFTASKQRVEQQNVLQGGVGEIKETDVLCLKLSWITYLAPALYISNYPHWQATIGRVFVMSRKFKTISYNIYVFVSTFTYLLSLCQE